METPRNLIQYVQLDPNGLCNAKCWFCPVAYTPNPEFARQNMPIDKLDGIVRQLREGVGDFVSETFYLIFTAHYSEVLLYKHFSEMLEIFRKYRFTTTVLTNGTPLTQEKVEAIRRYPDVVIGLNINIPSAEAVQWAKLTGMDARVFERVMKNIRYAIDALPDMAGRGDFSLQLNGVNHSSLPEHGGWIEPMQNAPAMDLDNESGTLHQAVEQFSKRFPELKINQNNQLVDRAGYLEKQGILSNEKAIKNYLRKGKSSVVACNNMGSRADNWLTINAVGDIFMCCNDYDFETVYANVFEQSLKDIWLSDARQAMIKRSYADFCTTCTSAVWA